PGPPRTPPPTLTSTRPAVRWFPVGAPPRCEAEPSQNTEPAPIAPEAGAPTVQSTPRRHAAAGISCRSTAPGAKTEPGHNTEPTPSAPGAGAPTVPSTPRPTRRCGYFRWEPRPRCETGAQSEPRARPNRPRGGCSYGSEHA